MLNNVNIMTNVKYILYASKQFETQLQKFFITKFEPSVTDQNVSHPTVLSKTISTSLLYNRICLH